MVSKYGDHWVQSGRGVLALSSHSKKEIRNYSMFDRRSSVEQTGHMLTYGTSKLGSLVDQNSWIEFTPLGVGSWRGHSLKPVSRSGPTGGPSRGANPGLDKLGSGFSIFLMKGCHVQFTGSCMWCVPSYLLEDVNRFKSPQFSDMNAVLSRLNIVSNYDATSIQVVVCEHRVIMMAMN